MKVLSNLALGGGKGLLVFMVMQMGLAAVKGQIEIDSLQQTGAFRFEVDVNLVNVTATVTDKKGNLVKGLTREDFELYEDGKRQEIVHTAADENAPLSLAIILDTSGSMVDKIDDARDALKHFLASINPKSESCVFQFETIVRLVQDFTPDPKKLGNALESLYADGATAMYDAVSQAVIKLKEGQFSKKAILLITDGNDTVSKNSFKEVREELQRSDVLIYVIGIGHGERGSYGHGSIGGAGDEVNKKVLEDFTKDTGGRTFIVKGAHVVKGKDVIDEAARAVAKDLYYQYILAYVSSNESGNGDWRKIKVKVKKKKVHVLARRGYRRPRRAEVTSKP